MVILHVKCLACCRSSQTSEIKFVPASENILLGSLYSERILLYVLLGCLC